MEFIDTELPGVKRVVPKRFGDHRGFFMETWQEHRFHVGGIGWHFVQDNHSLSRQYVLRGIHYQIFQPQGKLVRVVRGEVFDVAVDLRRSSPDFGRWTGVTLSADNHEQLWVPPGFGHAFVVMSIEAEFVYKCTDYYAPEHERSIRWDAPDIGIKWPLPPGTEPVLSDKDAAAPVLADAEVYP